jgi:hypothetical protein
MSSEERLALFDQSSDGYFYQGDELRKKVRREELVNAGVPASYCMNKTPIDAEVLAFIKVWLADWNARSSAKPSRNFYIHADLSNAQHAEAVFAALLRNVAHRCFSIECISAVDLAEKARDVDKLHRYYSVACLGIYNFGNHHKDREGYYDHFFYKILSARSLALLPTLLLSSHSMEDLQRKVFVTNENPLPDQISRALIAGNIMNVLNRYFEKVSL